MLGELEKMGKRFKLALKIIKDSRIQRLTCTHKGLYADDCIVQRITQVQEAFCCYLNLKSIIYLLLYNLIGPGGMSFY